MERPRPGWSVRNAAGRLPTGSGSARNGDAAPRTVGVRALEMVGLVQAKTLWPRRARYHLESSASDRGDGGQDAPEWGGLATVQRTRPPIDLRGRPVLLPTPNGLDPVDAGRQDSRLGQCSGMTLEKLRRPESASRPPGTRREKDREVLL